MKLKLDITLLKAILEHTHAFIGVYDIDNAEFLCINRQGLEMMEISTLDVFKENIPKASEKINSLPTSYKKYMNF